MCRPLRRAEPPAELPCWRDKLHQSRTCVAARLRAVSSRSLALLLLLLTRSLSLVVSFR